MKPQALHSNVVLQPINFGTIVIGGGVFKGKVVSVGEEVKSLKKGDIVAYNEVKQQVSDGYVTVPYQTVLYKL